MFNVSQKLMLGSTPNLSLRTLLHHPLPLNPRESQRLYDILTTSFRNQLDKEHGPLASNSNDGGNQSPTSTDTDAPSNARRERDSHSGKHPADRHLSRVLGNPLLSFIGGNRRVFRKDPMDVFEAAVAKGMMDIEAATNCLMAKKAEVIQSYALNVRDGMRDSKAGTRVLKWLISSGHANNLDFIRNQRFSVIFMQYLVAEGLQEACWTWIRRSFKDVPRIFQLPDYSDERKRLKNEIVTPLTAFLLALSARPASLDAAYIALAKAARYFPDLSLTQAREILGGSISRIASLTKTVEWDRPPPTESNFDSLLQIMPASNPRFQYDLAHLRLLHPTRPSAEDALKMLREVYAHGPPRLLPRKSRSEELQGDVEGRILHLGLSAAKYLLKQNQYREADEVMACLRLHFSTQLGLNSHKQQERLEDSEAEAASLEMLDNLRFA
jgi:hypothetical protein